MTSQGFRCRLCRSDNLQPVIDLGLMPLANDLRTPDQDPIAAARFPLAAVRCLDCTLVQITETVPPEILFRDYAYFSSFSDSFLSHARKFADRMIDERALSGDDLVLEIASNDGYLLKHFVARGVRALGVEPARNVASAAREVGVTTIDEFFDADLAAKVVAEHGHASIAVANNVLAHVADLHGVVSGLATVVGDTGTVVVETPYLIEMINQREFDTIYHEHLCYYSVTAVNQLFALHGLVLVDVEQLAVHGGSLRIFAEANGVPGRTVEELLAREEEWGIRSASRYDEFAFDVAKIRDELPALLSNLRSSASSVAGYGAAAKAAVILNACHLDAEDVMYVVDRNPVKQGRLMPGTRIPIVPPERLANDRPDYVIVFVWNILDEVRAQQTRYEAAGGQFIVAIPSPRVV